MYNYMKNIHFVIGAYFLSKQVKPLEFFATPPHAPRLSTYLSTDSVDIAVTIACSRRGTETRSSILRQ
jgi:hypothetical protein